MHEGELAIVGRLGDDGSRTTGHVTDQPGQVDQADNDDQHLHEVSQGYRPHATEQGVQQHDHGTDQHALSGADKAVGQHVEHHAQGGELRGDPAQVRQDDHDTGDHFHIRAKALAEEVTDGQQVHAVQRTGENQAHQHQAAERTEWVFDDAGKAFLDEGGRNPQYGLGAEPGREHHRRHQGKGHAAATGREVFGAFHAGRCVETDTYREQKVNRYKPNQHLHFPLARPVPDWRARLGQGYRD
ncbi:hypothetical protein D3C85_992280 [compost metagenome]